MLAVTTQWLVTIMVIIVHFMIAESARLILYSMAGDQAISEARAIYMNRFATFTDLGLAVGPILSFGLYSGIGFAAVAAVAVAILLLVLVFLRALHRSERIR